MYMTETKDIMKILFGLPLALLFVLIVFGWTFFIFGFLTIVLNSSYYATIISFILLTLVFLFIVIYPYLLVEGKIFRTKLSSRNFSGDLFISTVTYFVILSQIIVTVIILHELHNYSIYNILFIGIIHVIFITAIQFIISPFVACKEDGILVQKLQTEKFIEYSDIEGLDIDKDSTTFKRSFGDGTHTIMIDGKLEEDFVEYIKPKIISHSLVED